MDDFADLTAACHKRGINVCLDFVMNHTSEDHEWQNVPVQEKKNIKTVTSSLTTMIFLPYMSRPARKFSQLLHLQLTWLEDLHKHVMTTFYPYQWDLNYRNPIVLNEMIF